MVFQVKADSSAYTFVEIHMVQLVLHTSLERACVPVRYWRSSRLLIAAQPALRCSAPTIAMTCVSDYPRAAVQLAARLAVPLLVPLSVPLGLCGWLYRCVHLLTHWYFSIKSSSDAPTSEDFFSSSKVQISSHSQECQSVLPFSPFFMLDVGEKES